MRAWKRRGQTRDCKVKPLLTSPLRLTDSYLVYKQPPFLFLSFQILFVYINACNSSVRNLNTMAMRPTGGGAAAPRRGGARSGVVRSVYEDIKPVAEWQQDDDNHILNIYLPGFIKQQIKVSTEGRNTIRVRGERLVAGNKWNRFSEDYQVPDNGEMNSVRAKYQGGILTISIPKVRVDPRPPKTEGVDEIRNQPSPQKGPEKEVGTSQATGSTIQETNGKGTEPKKPAPVQDGGQEQPTPQKGQDQAFPTADATRQSTDKKSVEPEKTLGDPKTRHDQDSNQRGRSFTPLKRTTLSNDTVRNEHVASQRPDDVRKTTENKEGKGNTELPDVGTDKMTLEKDRAASVHGKKTDNKELHGALTKDKYKKAVKGLTELNEERQSLANMGVAMLVIVALTAYVTYSFASAKDKN